MGSRLQPGEKVLIWAPRCCSPSTWQVAWEGQGHGLVGSRGLGEARAILSLSYAILLHSNSKGSFLHYLHQPGRPGFPVVLGFGAVILNIRSQAPRNQGQTRGGG